MPIALALRHLSWHTWRGSVHSLSRRQATSQQLGSLIARVGPRRLGDAALIWAGAPSPYFVTVCSACVINSARICSTCIIKSVKCCSTCIIEFCQLARQICTSHKLCSSTLLKPNSDPRFAPLPDGRRQRIEIPYQQDATIRPLDLTRHCQFSCVWPLALPT